MSEFDKTCEECDCPFSSYIETICDDCMCKHDEWLAAASKKKDEEILKLRTAMNSFCDEFHRCASSSFSEPMDHDDCKRFYKHFNKVLEKK